MSKMLLVLVSTGALSGLVCAADAQEVKAPPPTAPSISHRALDLAIADLQSQLAANPKDAVGHNRLGVCYQQKQQLKMARKQYEKALDLSPGYAEAWNNLGTIDHVQRKYKKAVARYRKALELKPETATYYRNLGAAWLGSNKIELAVAAYTNALRLDPQSLQSSESTAFPGSGVDRARLFHAYAKVFAAKGDLESAFMWLQRASEAGFRDWSRVSSDRDFAEVVKDARYTELAR